MSARDEQGNGLLWLVPSQLRHRRSAGARQAAPSPSSRGLQGRLGRGSVRRARADSVTALHAQNEPELSRWSEDKYEGLFFFFFKVVVLPRVTSVGLALQIPASKLRPGPAL